MAVNNFKPKKFYDHTIVGPDGRFVGHIRVKPSGIHWAPADAKEWYGVPLAKFIEFMQAKGTRKQK